MHLNLLPQSLTVVHVVPFACVRSVPQKAQCIPAGNLPLSSSRADDFDGRFALYCRRWGQVLADVRSPGDSDTWLHVADGAEAASLSFAVFFFMRCSTDARRSTKECCAWHYL